jgi:hypothetical protein
MAFHTRRIFTWYCAIGAYWKVDWKFGSYYYATGIQAIMNKIALLHNFRAAKDRMNWFFFIAVTRILSSRLSTRNWPTFYLREEGRMHFNIICSWRPWKRINLLAQQPPKFSRRHWPFICKRYFTVALGSEFVYGNPLLTYTVQHQF